MKRYSLICLCCLLCSAFAWSQTEGVLHERVYLQTDKPLYLAGELVWLKMLTTDHTGRPLTFSKVGYVELLDESSDQVQAKIELADGVGEGWLMLPLTLPTGNYRLVAYTRYMQNEGKGVYFERLLPVVNTFTTDHAADLAADSVAAPYEVGLNTIGLAVDRLSYATRSNGQLQLSGLPADLHTLSVSIAGREPIPVPAQPALSQQLAQWKASPVAHFDTRITAEYEGHILTGKLLDMQGRQPATNETLIPMLGFTGAQIRVFGGRLDEQANVEFFTKRISGTHEIATTAFHSGTGSYRVDIQSPYATPEAKPIPRLALNPVWKDYLLERSVGLQVLHGFQADSMSQTLTQPAMFQWTPTRSYLLDEYTRFTTMEEVVIEFIPSLRFTRFNNKRILSVLTEERTSFTVGNSLVLLDGIPIVDHENIFRYDPLKVKTIDVYRGRFAFGEQIINGIASFKTYDNDYSGLSVDPSTQFFDYEGTQPLRLFHVPAYDTDAQRRSRLPDYRHTLLWQPIIPLDGSTTLTIPFTTSDLTGDFLITVEGLTRNGQAVYGTSIFRVE